MIATSRLPLWRHAAHAVHAARWLIATDGTVPELRLTVSHLAWTLGRSFSCKKQGINAFRLWLFGAQAVSTYFDRVVRQLSSGYTYDTVKLATSLGGC